VCCSVLQHVAACLWSSLTWELWQCCTLQRTTKTLVSHSTHVVGAMVYRRRRLTCTATHCNTLQHIVTHCNTLQHTATHYNRECHGSQSTALDTHCNTLQHTATHCDALQCSAVHYHTLQHTATHCNTLQHTATHCNTLQHTATVGAVVHSRRRAARKQHRD